jgi:hypothetical protein
MNSEEAAAAGGSSVRQTLDKSDQTLKEADNFFDNLRKEREKIQKSLKSENNDVNESLGSFDHRIKSSRNKSSSDLNIKRKTESLNSSSNDLFFENYDKKSNSSQQSIRSETKKSEPAQRRNSAAIAALASTKTQYKIDQDLDKIELVEQRPTAKLRNASSSTDTESYRASTRPNANNSKFLTSEDDSNSSKTGSSKIRKLFRSSSKKSEQPHRQQQQQLKTTASDESGASSKTRKRERVKSFLF